MDTAQFFLTLGKPIEEVGSEMQGLDGAVNDLVVAGNASGAEVDAFRAMIVKGQSLFVEVAQAIAHRGDGWTESGAAKEAVEEFLLSFKQVADAVRSDHPTFFPAPGETPETPGDVPAGGAMEPPPVEPQTPAPVDTATTQTETEQGADGDSTHDAAAQVASENQELNKEQTDSENDDATLVAAEHEAAAPGNDEYHQ